MGLLLFSAMGVSLARGWADVWFRSGGDDGIAIARRLVPGNSAYFGGELTDTAALRHAVSVNRRLAPVWVELGLQAEAAGDLREAERCLLEAASVDQTYQTRWTVANYYFRRGDLEKFWPWARLAAEISYFTQTALFRLCWQTGAGPATILERAIPSTPSLLGQYLAFLLNEGKINEAEAAARRLLPLARPSEASLFSRYCGRLAEAGRAAQALEFWNASCRRGLLPFHPLDPGRGASLTNGDFSSAPGAGGFDWRTGSAEGLDVFPVSSPRALRLSLSGRQPEQCLLLEQWAPVLPGGTYRLSYWLRVAPGGRTDGIRWRVADPSGRSEYMAAALGAAGSSWSQQTATFRVPAGVEMVRLALEYRREPGTTRTETDLWLRQVTLAFDGSSGAQD